MCPTMWFLSSSNHLWGVFPLLGKLPKPKKSTWPFYCYGLKGKFNIGLLTVEITIYEVSAEPNLIPSGRWWRFWVSCAKQNAPDDSRLYSQFWIKWVEDIWEILLFLLEWIPVMLLTSTEAINTHKAIFAKPVLPNGSVSLYQWITKTFEFFSKLVFPRAPIQTAMEQLCTCAGHPPPGCVLPYVHTFTFPTVRPPGVPL